MKRERARRAPRRRIVHRWLFTLVMVVAVRTGSALESLQEIVSWAYQLQDLDLAAVAANQTFQLLVMDYSADGSDAAKYTPQELTQLRESGKTLLAYISIGEAESYRWYWDPAWDADGDGQPDPGAPGWLGPGNPDWEGNYKVRFWDPQWRQLVFDYVDTLVTQGFDGIYMDIIDAYYYWAEENGEEPRADSLMVRFVQDIRSHLADEPGFFLVPQNGAYILVEPHVTEQMAQEYLDAVDGLGVEDLFFCGDEDNDNPYNPDSERLEMVRRFSQAGKRVLSVEYLTLQPLIDQYLSDVDGEGFVPYVTTRFLDTLYDGRELHPVPLSPVVNLCRIAGGALRLQWNSVRRAESGLPISVNSFNIWASCSAQGADFQFQDATADTQWVVDDAEFTRRFYRVTAVLDDP